MEYTIREYHPSDPISHFPEGYSDQIANLLRAQLNSHLSQSFVAIADGMVVGLCGYYQNKLHYHPNDFRLVLVTIEHHAEISIKQRLYETIVAKLRKNCSMFRSRVLVATDPEEVAFWEDQGYQYYYSVFEPTILVASLGVDRFQDILAAVSSNGYKILSLSECDLASVQGELLSLCIDSYDRVHVTSPPSLYEDWQSIFFGSEFDPSSFFIITKASKVVGFSSIKINTDGLTGELMWDGVARSEAAVAFPLRMALKLYEMRFAQMHRLKVLNWELDSVDIVGIRIMRALPFDVEEPYRSYVKEIYSA